MEEKCSFCGLKYEIEPGFFWGSMYISYAIGVIIFVAVVICGYIFLGDPEAWVYIVLLLAILLPLSPLIYRISRIVMLYAFGSIKYDPRAAKETQIKK